MCSRVRCPSYSQCLETPDGHPECRCIDGYQDTDYGCKPINSEATTDCRDEDKCDINAQCTYSSLNGGYQCECLAGFQGDGYNCTRVSGTAIK